jgi:hypothetical protein
MANLGYTYDPSQVEDNFQPKAPGQYEATITESSMKDTQTGFKQLELVFDVEGTKVWERLNLIAPPNATDGQRKAEEIANRILKRICEACGVGAIDDSDELHGIPMIVDVEIERGEPYVKNGVQKQGVDKNVIKRYYPISGGAADIPFDNPTPSNTPPQAAATRTPPRQPAARAGAPTQKTDPWAKSPAKA